MITNLRGLGPQPQNIGPQGRRAKRHPDRWPRRGRRAWAGFKGQRPWWFRNVRNLAC